MFETWSSIRNSTKKREIKEKICILSISYPFNGNGIWRYSCISLFVNAVFHIHIHWKLAIQNPAWKLTTSSCSSLFVQFSCAPRIKIVRYIIECCKIEKGAHKTELWCWLNGIGIISGTGNSNSNSNGAIMYQLYTVYSHSAYIYILNLRMCHEMREHNV